MLNEIIHGDCLEVMSKMEPSSVDLVLTDPPYRLIAGGCKPTKNRSGAGLMTASKIENVKSGKLFDHNDIKFDDWIPEVYKVLKDKSHFYCFINYHNMKEVMEVSERSGFTLNNILVMVKDNIVVNPWYMKNVEYVLFFRKGGMKPLNNNSDNTAVMVRMPKKENKIHPTQKPVPYLEMLIKNSSDANEIVFDPFAGSGSTALACLNTERNFITCEIDNDFYKKTKQCIDDHMDFVNGQLLAF